MSLPKASFSREAHYSDDYSSHGACCRAPPTHVNAYMVNTDKAITSVRLLLTTIGNVLTLIQFRDGIHEPSELFVKCESVP